MADNIVKFYPKDAGKNPDAVLEQAIGKYESVFIIGYDNDGIMDVRASTNLDQKNILWLVEMFKHKMMAGDYCD